MEQQCLNMKRVSLALFWMAVLAFGLPLAWLDMLGVFGDNWLWFTVAHAWVLFNLGVFYWLYSEACDQYDRARNQLRDGVAA